MSFYYLYMFQFCSRFSGYKLPSEFQWICRKTYRDWGAEASTFCWSKNYYLLCFLDRDDTVSVFLSQTLHVQTTRSWDFVGFSVKAERQKQIESDIIIGVMDTGLSGLSWIPSATKGSGLPQRNGRGLAMEAQTSLASCNNYSSHTYPSLHS